LSAVRGVWPPQIVPMQGSLFDSSLLNIGRTEFELFRSLIHRQTGIYLRDGKEVMLAARLARRVRALGLSDFAAYYRHLETARDQASELGELINCVTTNKTAFFREKHHFDFLAEHAQELLDRAGGGTLKVWSAACSTGEEPYSVAMTLLEAQRSARGGWGRSWQAEIAASDIDTGVLDRAVRGIYPSASLDDIPPEMRKRYLLRGSGPMNGSFKIKQEVGRLVEFRRINLMDAVWPLKAGFDVIFFRNALIYFQQDVQDLFLRRMIRMLHPGGYLFLGHAENIPWLHDLVRPLEHTIYQVRGVQ
jgi:chemotaxis protein methyltransferase CheR